MPITSPVLFISGPEQRVHARELHEREHRLLHREVSRHHLLGEAQLGELRPAITSAASFASGTPIALDTKGTVREARGFTSST
jgi:hypothetical protein